MNKVAIFFVFTILGAVVCRAIRPEELVKQKKFMRILDLPGDINVDASDFTYSNCGSASDPVQINSLTVLPAPVTLGKPVTVAAQVTLTEDLYHIAADVTIQKKMLGHWTNIPCVDNIGSCQYADVCEMLVNQTCPEEFTSAGIPCNCPFSAGVYNLPSTTVDTTDPGLSWLTSGEFHANVVLSQYGSRLCCYDFYVTIGN
mmetsp:Transcript_18600/g.26086  ORF Transcript_18600/g.26086 Transcript_18600/m.26086 type:complete len:201 (+) Transcript_18600:57-659(+)|eukprot:CAMPEP_0168567474 /NCGR_PEP_ID=MMETSP0413-20121227/15031_1 /TAXON_ID=136452 /ORGANISM="Filamoeba nolandi, Strain NC-AS-23-1" /LENGTH=200 /DNA_ID=CAMNT_0008599681 /DNA_START=20 /DNA_END=622 /DNA_ORIENTATION=-